MITLGSAGDDLSIAVPVDADFVTTITSTISWPTGTTVELHFINQSTDVPIVWVATVSGSSVTFNIPAATVQAVVAAQLSIARLIYKPGGTGAILWAHGPVRYV